MRIALLIGHFPPGDFGGAELQAEQWARRLAVGHEVVVVTRRDPAGQPASEVRDGYRIIRLPVAALPGWRTVADLIAIEQAVRALEPRPQLLLCFQTFISGLAGARLQGALGIPAVIWIRGEAEYRFDQSPIHHWVAPWAWSRSRAVLVQSDRNRSDLLEAMERRSAHLYREVGPRVEVIGNGVELPETLPSSSSSALTVGRLIPDKGMDLVIEAAAAENIPLTVAGDGPERASLEALARDRGADCRFTGFVSREGLQQLYRDCGFVVLAARRGEGLPNVLLEAMALARPVIATPCAGTKDLVVSGENGLLVPSEDLTALRSAMRRLHDAPDEARRMGRLARVRAEASSWEHWMHILEAGLGRWTGPSARAVSR